jgi:hypothetical protein
MLNYQRVSNIKEVPLAITRKRLDCNRSGCATAAAAVGLLPERNGVGIVGHISMDYNGLV